MEERIVFSCRCHRMCRETGVEVTGTTQGMHPEADSRSRDAGVIPDYGQFLLTLKVQVAERFERLGDAKIVTLPLDVPAPALAWQIPDPPCHPACSGFDSAEYCRQRWQARMAELRRRPTIQRHRCPFGMLCATVPVVWRGRCLGVCQLVCPQAQGEKLFDRNIELVVLLIENYEAREPELLSRLANPQAVVGAEPVPRMHRNVLRTIEYINSHLSDPTMSVGSIAQLFATNASYLAHLFSQQVHERMSRYIALRRLALAMELLDTTQWQIKRIAVESGHSNTNWFSHTFHEHTGMTPTQYRARSINDENAIA